MAVLYFYGTDITTNSTRANLGHTTSDFQPFFTSSSLLASDENINTDTHVNVFLFTSWDFSANRALAKNLLHIISGMIKQISRY